jgi:putative Mg2+ transporter-C (MgtC) family protein
MPTTLTWHSIALRLLLTALCSAVLGIDRDERGRSAGLRTNLLVGLAACLAMVQANWLINSNGRAVDSFAVMDIMRLPLGILSGIGFIGGGVILKRGELAVGVTTAATIWFVTVMGLCFGGGQLGLGFAGFGLGLLTLRGLKKIEIRIPRQHSGSLKVTVAPNGMSQDEIASLLMRGRITVSEPSLCLGNSPTEGNIFGWKLEWKGKHDDTTLPEAVKGLAAHPGIRKLELTR